MAAWNDLLKSRKRRALERDKKRRQALTKAKSAVRRERREITKRQSRADELRRKAVAFEREGKPALAKQLVRQMVQIDKEATARTLAVANMDYALEQVRVKDNYEDFVRGMDVVARIEELAREGTDPDEVRERLQDLAQRNHDLVEPWTESTLMEAPGTGPEATLTAEEEKAYTQVVSEAAGEIESNRLSEQTVAYARMDEELEQKMDTAMARG